MSSPLDDTPERRRARLVHALARRHVVDRDRADDLAQQVWLVALHRSTGDGPSAALLSTLTRRLAIDGFRMEHVRRALHLTDAAGARGVDEELVAHEARRLVIAAVAELKEPYRQAIRLRFLEELPPRAIAVRLGVSVETVNTRIKRGLTMLRAKLARRFERGQPLWTLLCLRQRLVGRHLPLTACAALAASVLMASFALAYLRRPTAGTPEVAAAGAPAAVVLAGAPPAARAVIDPFPATPERAPTPARSVTGRVFDERGGRAGFARVQAYEGARLPEDGEVEPVASVVCAADGSFTLAGLPEAFVLEAHDAQRVSSEIVSAEPGAETPEGLSFELHEAHATRGIVRGATAGRVLLVRFEGVNPVRLAGPSGVSYQPRRAHAAVAADGRFELAPLPAGRASLFVVVPGFAAEWFSIDLPAGDLELELDPGTDLELYVQDARGAPVPDLSVTCIQARPRDAPLVGKGWLRLEQEATTDARGRCRFPARRTDSECVLSVRRGERVLAVRRLTCPLEPAPIRLLLAEDTGLAGTVRDATGLFLSGARVVLLAGDIPSDHSARGFPPGRTTYTLARADTDDRGRFRIPFAPPGPARLEITSADRSRSSMLELSGRERDVEVVLALSERRVRCLTVLDRASGQPVVGFDLFRTSSRGRVGHSWIDDPDGRCRLELLESEPEHFAIRSPGRAPCLLEPEELAHERITVRLDPTCELELVLLDRNGRPLRECTVRALDPDGRACMVEAGNGQARSSLAPGHDGRLRLRGLPATALMIEVWTATCVEPERFPLDPRAVAGPVELELDACDQSVRPGALHLTLLRPCAGADAGAEPWSGLVELVLRDARGARALQLRGTLDAAGFRREGAPPQSVLTSKRGVSTFFTRPAEPFWSDAANVLSRLPVVPAGTLEVRLGDGPRGRVPIESNEITLVVSEDSVRLVPEGVGRLERRER